MNVRRSQILIVDDERCNRQVLSDIIAEEHDAVCAESGPQALDIVGKQPIDLILLDVLMPEMDGYEVCRRLKESPDTARIPVLFVTSKNDPRDETRGLDVGAIDYLIKPVHPSVILARVRNHLALKQYADLLARQSFLDGLTGIPNRRYLDETLDKEWRRALREEQVLSLLLIDIDFFKRYNDLYGHPAGDDCLRRVAAALSHSVSRGSDLVARYGGEEFTILLPGDGAVGAVTVAERAMAAISALQIVHLHSEVSAFLTISIGIATALPCRDMTPATLLQMADRALYQAKEQGRNRYVQVESLIC